MFDGYRVYKQKMKDGRYRACLYHPITKHRLTTSWARYLMSVHLGRMLDKTLETVDHINGDNTDDRLENLQLLTLSENARKSAKPSAPLVVFVCPVCKKKFKRRKGSSNLVPSRKHYGTPCCSNRCRGIKSHWKK